MAARRIIHVVSAHAEGEVGDVIVGGVAPPPGNTIWDQSRALWTDGTLRRFLLNEPRGGVFRHVNLLVPPKHPDADAAFIIMEPEDNPPMSGSNAICVATVLLETGILAMSEPETRLTLEAPGGLVPVVAQCKDGKVTEVRLQNLPSFADRLGETIEVPGHGDVSVDTAFGGDSFVAVDVAQLGLNLAPNDAHDLARIGTEITRAADAQLGFQHPDLPEWDHFSFCLFYEAPRRESGVIQTRTTVSIRPGKLDRSPCGTGVSALMAILHAKGEMQPGEMVVSRSIVDGRFTGRIVGVTEVAARPAILPEIAGQAWITGTHQHMLDPTDPWPEGYRLSDTWGAH